MLKPLTMKERFRHVDMVVLVDLFDAADLAACIKIPKQRHSLTFSDPHWRL